MNAALVNAIAERLRDGWKVADDDASREMASLAAMRDARRAAEAVADFVAALPHGYTAPDVLAAIRGESIETTGAGQAPASPDDDAATISAASAAAPVPDPYFLLRDHVASVARVLRDAATGDERDGVWEEGYSDALADLVEALGVPA